MRRWREIDNRHCVTRKNKQELMTTNREGNWIVKDVGGRKEKENKRRKNDFVCLKTS